MSVRPRSGQPNPARGGDGRRLRWSEAPIPRPGVRRVRAAGLTASLYSSAQSGLGASLATTIDVIPGGGAAPAVGMVALTFAMDSGGGTLTPPSGWTELGSGVVTNLRYWVGYRRIAGSDPETFTRGSTTGTMTCTTMFWEGIPTTATAQISTITEASSTASATLNTLGSGWFAGAQVVGFLQGRVASGSAFWPKFSTTASDGHTDPTLAHWGLVGSQDRNDTPQSVVSWVSATAGSGASMADGIHPGTAYIWTDDARTTPYPVAELVRFAVGWSA